MNFVTSVTGRDWDEADKGTEFLYNAVYVQWDITQP